MKRMEGDKLLRRMTPCECKKLSEELRTMKELTEGLPEGWKVVPSRSRPGEFSYENEYTKERYSRRPTEVACGRKKPKSARKK